MSTIAHDPLEQFDAVVAADPNVDRHVVYARLREDRPIFFSEPLEAWVLTRYDDVRRVLEDEENFLEPRRRARGPGLRPFAASVARA